MYDLVSNALLNHPIKSYITTVTVVITRCYVSDRD